MVSSPNWFSWFGLARWVGETILKRPFHSSDQPYDDWKTLWKYQRELAPEFPVVQARGVWYLPPMQYKGKGLPASWTKGIYTLFRPLDRFFSKVLPFFGHLIVLKCYPQKTNFFFPCDMKLMSVQMISLRIPRSLAITAIKYAPSAGIEFHKISP